jgi:nucleoside-triphosphatase
MVWRSCEPVNLLLTGPPRCGKTTLVERVVEALEGRLMVAGFLTREVREEGDRTGFDIITLEGEAAPLSRKGAATGPRVGSYRVDVHSLETVAVPSMESADAQAFVVDEIGVMELVSKGFRKAVLDLLDDPRPLLATIRWRAHPFCDEVKERQDTEVILVDRRNRDTLVGTLSTRLLEAVVQS